MNGRVRSLCRSPLRRDEGFHRYLKPGALAQLRDSRISARSQKPNLQTQIYLYRFTKSIPISSSLQIGDNIQTQIATIDEFPCFSGRIYGPRCPQRKKLVAAKSFFFLSSSPSIPVSDSPDSLMDVLNTDLLETMAEPKTKYDRQLRSIKLDFLTFDGTDPSTWLSLAERYMHFYNIPDDQRVDMADFSLKERRSSGLSGCCTIIWGEQGQEALELASICLLSCGSTGSETLKNLVLGGIGSNGSKVEAGDLGNNFMLDESSIGQSKAKCVCGFVQELNDAVKSKFVEESPEALIEANPSFSQFTLAIATQLLEVSVVQLDRICRHANVMLILTSSYGLTGLVRISFKSEICDTFDRCYHPQANSWPRWDPFVMSLCTRAIDLEIPSIEGTQCGREYIADDGDGEAPLEGSIPDVTSLTELTYVNLQKIYQAKAEADFLVVEQWVRKILKRIGRDPDAISKTTVCRYHPIEEEFNSPVLPELLKYLTDEDYSVAVGFYILLRAFDCFTINYNRLPGLFDG
ncbi:hypothetical protein HHK36_003263 [Tetracentron sinense]|uniref:THIF-type NAD/FAD binding fold domain-containing protein n=1 Tax=Tetracentron sinense TaxID=13715 RepID=A0A834ZNZ4_TETSI|nr:hypothetical protein HHK36_003263 [Tetracentron sinense]